MSFINSLHWRYAVKKFSSKRLDSNQVNTLIESVRLSPSAFGLQPFQLIVIEKDEIKQKLHAACFAQTQITSCSHLFLLAYKTQITQPQIQLYIEQLANAQQVKIDALNAYQTQIEQNVLSLSSEQQKAMAQEQCYIALGTLLTVAALEQIDTCPMTGFDTKAVNNILNLTEKGLSAAVLCAAGFRAEDDTAANRPKFRVDKQALVVNI